MIFIPVFHAGNHGIAPILGTKQVFFSFGPDEFWNNTNETAAEASFETLSRKLQLENEKAHFLLLFPLGESQISGNFQKLEP